jgi:serine/threonine protein kinase
VVILACAHIIHEFADKILGKMGEGTFGRVLECWDRDGQELVAIKVIRSAQKYREDAMIEIDVLSTLDKNDKMEHRSVTVSLYLMDLVVSIWYRMASLR